MNKINEAMTLLEKGIGFIITGAGIIISIPFILLDALLYED